MPSSTQNPPTEKENNRGQLEAMKRRIQELEAQVAQSSASQAVGAPSVPNESVIRPKNASKITVREIRAELGYDKIRWNSFRSYCRDATTSARLNWDANWKSQRSEKLSMAYNAIEDDEDEFLAASDLEALCDNDDEDEREAEAEVGRLSVQVNGRRKVAEQGGKNLKQVRRKRD
ncbi:hypothetical protein FB451DRAFT_1172836 [Mycena latifolia]|nr:hypothetical protein FB451DRAFT_1172836 [Mycena latifolia]